MYDGLFEEGGFKHAQDKAVIYSRYNDGIHRLNICKQGYEHVINE